MILTSKKICSLVVLVASGSTTPVDLNFDDA